MKTIGITGQNGFVGSHLYNTLGLNPEKINAYGGSIAAGHSICNSGAGIITALISVLTQEYGKYGVAAVCNEDGGVSAIVIENLKRRWWSLGNCFRKSN